MTRWINPQANIAVEFAPTDDFMMGNGSSLMGHITTSYDKLVELFGEPNDAPGDKTWNAWDIEFKVWNVEDEDFDCVYCSIYDWKEMGPECSSTGTYQWHIGGHHNKEHRAEWLMMDLLELSDKPDYRFYPGFTQVDTGDDAKEFVNTVGDE